MLLLVCYAKRCIVFLLWCLFIHLASTLSSRPPSLASCAPWSNSTTEHKLQPKRHSRGPGHLAPLLCPPPPAALHSNRTVPSSVCRIPQPLPSGLQYLSPLHTYSNFHCCLLFVSCTIIVTELHPSDSIDVTCLCLAPPLLLCWEVRLLEPQLSSHQKGKVLFIFSHPQGI